MVEVIVITSAPGQQAAHLIPRLYWQERYQLRLVVNSDASQKSLQEQYPKSEVIQADLCDTSAVANLVRNATTIYHIGPSFHLHEAEIGYNMIDAAVTESRRPESSFKHFVYSSVLNSQLTKMLNHGRKNLVEGYLMETRLNYTILGPGHFMDRNIQMLVNQANQDKPVYKALYNPENLFSFMSLEDLSEISHLVIEQREAHYFAQYPLCSTEAMSYIDFVRIMSKVIGKEVQIERVGYQEAVDLMSSMIFKTKEPDQRFKDGPERMLLFYNTHPNALVGNTKICRELLKREPTSIEQAARALLKARE